jgi:hypothetical protein
VVERLAAWIADHGADELPKPVAEALGAVPFGGGGEVAATLARRGYLGRRAETGLFAAARPRTPGLRERLRRELEQSARWADAVAAVSAELARAEPGERPDPHAEGWTSWRVPGPGGHVRHYLALATAPQEAAGLDRAEVKRAWLYGLYVRCCEEILVPSAPASAS